MTDLDSSRIIGIISIGIVLSFLIMAIWIMIKANIVLKKKCEHEIWTEDIIRDKILSICKTGRDFEIFLYKFFKLEGYKVELTQATNDKGKDLVLKERSTGKVIFVEAKRYSPKNHVGREVVQKLLGACSMYGANEGYVITTSSFTKTAVDCLKHTNNLELWDLDVLVSSINCMDNRAKMELFRGV